MRTKASIGIGEAWPVLPPRQLVRACAGMFKPTKTDLGEKRYPRFAFGFAFGVRSLINRSSNPIAYRRSKMDPAEPGFSVMRATRLPGKRG